MPTAPQPVWHWPPAIMSLKDLTDAMRAGFSLSVIYTDRGNALYQLSRGAIVAPIGVLKQVVAHRAWTNGMFVRGEQQPDGWHPLTLKPKPKRAST
jgi:hypothetical protein